MCSDVYTWMGNGDTTQKICSDVHTRAGTLHINMCSDVHTRVGTPHMKICSDVGQDIMGKTNMIGRVVTIWKIMPLRGSIWQAGTCQILSLVENPRWSRVWQK